MHPWSPDSGRPSSFHPLWLVRRLWPSTWNHFYFKFVTNKKAKDQSFLSIFGCKGKERHNFFTLSSWLMFSSFSLAFRSSLRSFCSSLNIDWVSEASLSLENYKMDYHLSFSTKIKEKAVFVTLRVFRWSTWIYSHPVHVSFWPGNGENGFIKWFHQRKSVSP